MVQDTYDQENTAFGKGRHCRQNPEHFFGHREIPDHVDPRLAHLDIGEDGFIDCSFQRAARR
jgi:hypothetical protein